MRTVIEKIEKKFKLYHASGCSAEEVIAAEKALDLEFPEDYRLYVMKYGAISFGSVELSGLGVDDYINVVTMTKKEREINKEFPKDSFVLQNLGIEGFIIVQDEEGIVYQLDENGTKSMLAGGLIEYLETLI